MEGGGRGDEVTVVVPTRDRRDLLEVTLATILAQRNVAFEVIVVDDGSTHDVRAVTGMQDQRVRLLRRDTSAGVAAARNAGLAAARTRWVAFTDDDDLWAPDKLSAQLRALRAVPGARWSCVGAVDVDERMQLIAGRRPPPSGDVAAAVLYRNCIPGGASGVLAEADLVRALGGFDEGLSNSADYDMWIRLALAAPLASVDEPLLAYRVHEGGMSRQLDDILVEVARVRVKHAGPRASRGIVPAETVNIWIGDRHQRSGRRLPAARAYLRAAPTVGWRVAGARALEAVLWPGAFQLRDQRRAAAIPPAWSVGVDHWLEPIRTHAQGPAPVAR